MESNLLRNNSENTKEYSKFTSSQSETVLSETSEYTSNETSEFRLLKYYNDQLIRNHELDQVNKELAGKIKAIENKMSNQDDFLKTSANLNKLVFNMIITVPVILLICALIICIVIWVVTGDVKNLNLVYNALALFGLSSMGVGWNFIKKVNGRLEELEKKVEAESSKNS